MEKFEDDLKNNLEIIKGNIIDQNNFKFYEEESLERKTGLEGYNLTEPVIWKVFEQKEANFKGRIIGGCFDNIAELCGTKYDGGAEFVKRYKSDGIIWYFDNCEMSYESVLRTLWKFSELGYFENTNGIIFGRFGVQSTSLGYTMETLIKDSVLSKMNIPIIYDADISHKGPTMTIINGSIANVKVKLGKAVIHQILE